MGYIKIEVAGEGQRPAASPFHALEAAPAWPAPLRALAWDAASGAYRDYDDAPAVGEGVWLVNPAATAVTVYAAGEVPLDDALGVPLVPGLNLIAYPYLSAPAAESLTLDPAALTDAAGAPVAVLIPGDAYWYRHDGPTPQLWLATRPHENPFAVHANTPIISALQILDDGSGIQLTVDGHGGPDEALMIFRADFDPADPENVPFDWNPVSEAIPTRGRSRLEWRDPSPPLRAAIYVAMRVNPDRPHTWDLPPEVRDWRPMGQGGQTGDDTQTADWIPVVHVHAGVGDDRFSGRRPWRQGQDGPKKTVRAGLRVAPPDARLHIHAGTYGETLDIRGRDVRVVVHGRVVF